VKVVLAGGSGALGRRIATDLASRDYEVVILTRTPAADLPGRSVAWDGASVGPWADELAGSALINLCGAIVDRRPTTANIALRTGGEPACTPESVRYPKWPPSVVSRCLVVLIGSAFDQGL
jgi:uncharacterized protein